MMFKKALFIITIIGFMRVVNAQEPYKFNTIIDLQATEVISQGRTNTCWSFSSTSFLESEIIRLTGKKIDLSEMFTVRHTYTKKAENYVMRQGKAQFSEGGLAHDVLNSVGEHGLVPNSVFSGLFDTETNHNHDELITVLKSMVNAYADNPGKRLSKNWKKAVDAVLSIYLGNDLTSFTYDKKNYTPQSFLKMTALNPEDYISITSFSHAPFYSKFILNIPDNWSNGSFYNIPLDEMMLSINNALQKGFTIALDCDISESTFSSKDGVAVIPKMPADNEKAMKSIYTEKTITQQYRQDEFENFTTTDDHLMHITGMLKDQKGTKYYKVKNSWGSDSSRHANGGFVYFSESYMRLKAISIMLHKNAISKTIAGKLSLN